MIRIFFIVLLPPPLDCGDRVLIAVGLASAPALFVKRFRISASYLLSGGFAVLRTMGSGQDEQFAMIQVSRCHAAVLK
jgi:hypothetical protein